MAITNHLFKRRFLPIGLVIVTTLAIAATVSFSLQKIVHGTLLKNAENQAMQWASKFVAQFPDPKQIAQSGLVRPNQLRSIETAFTGANVFSFKFYAPSGDLKFAYDEDGFFAPDETTHNYSALEVFKSLSNSIHVKDGTANRYRPSTYVEAYLPVFVPSGEPFGVLEVYVDVSSLAETLTETYGWFGVILVLGSAIVFLVPSSILLFRNQKVNNALTQEAWLSAILYHAPFEVVIKDTEGKIRAISRNVTEEFDLEAIDFIGRTTADFLPEHIARKYMEADDELVRTGKATQKDVTEVVDGKTRYFLSSKFPLFGETGNIEGICSITNDITELRTAEEKFTQAQKMETIGQLTGGIAHDFNNLLSVVSGSLQLLGNSTEKDEQKRLSQVALRAIEQGSDLTKQMLALGRRSPLVSKPTDLSAYLDEFADFVTRILTANIHHDVGKSMEKTSITVDPGMLQNALLNLALNSKLAMPRGGNLSIHADIVSPSGDFPRSALLDGKCARIKISDSGIGISKDDLRNVFEPFYTTREVGEGSGLGLSMVKGFVEQSNGSIEIESELGHGTSVLIFLPLTSEQPLPPSKTVRSATKIAKKRRKGRVLVVEDNAQLLNLIALKLERDNFDVLKAMSGDEAISLLDEGAPVNLVLSDLVMPGDFQGSDVLRHAKLLSPPLPVILMSGYADIRASSEDDLKHADRFIEKPLKLDQLSEAIGDFLTD